MRYLKYLALVAVLMLPLAYSQAQVSVGVGFCPGYGGYVAGPPVCDWGYYDYYPYACAPYGYYGPQWFAGGVFIGAGPWFHGFHRRSFYGPRGFEGRFHGDFDRDGFRGRGFAHEGFVGRGFARGEVHGGGGFHGFHGGGFHGGGHGGHR